ncbi:hypothetical protein B0H13DRAFT_2273628 [Mycena leptocephala]|nr:hypothetical protein B0H13DRAFT_2273628 [Mycena leptocephala]
MAYSEPATSSTHFLVYFGFESDRSLSWLSTKLRAKFAIQSNRKLFSSALLPDMHGRRSTVLIVVASNEAATCACAIRLAILTATFLVIRFMSKDIAIIVILGSRKAGRKLAASVEHAKLEDRRLEIVEGFPSTLLPGLLGPPSLSAIEQNVEDQMKDFRGRNTDVAAIVFMCNRLGSCTHFPFTGSTSFLGLSGASLFGKLCVVAPSPGQNWERDWRDLVNQGMRILPSENRPDELFRQILDGHSSYRVSSLLISSEISAPSTETLPVPDVYAKAAAVNRRDPQRAVLLLFGQSGHGKSKTINRLIGQDLLPIGESTLGSTTKVIQRVKVLSTNQDKSATVTVAFDDTPGLDDTTYLDRKTNAALMHRYKQKHFEHIFPNVILLVASWDSLMLDAPNNTSKFTSALGRSMYNLSRSGLVDNDRTNVLVVITKSLSSWDQFDDYNTPKEKNAQWCIEAGRRKGIVADLQRKIFPKSAPWETVFIENGGGRDMSATFPFLPDGQHSHQNLFNSIRNLMERTDPGPGGCGDLVGIQSLQVLAGAKPLRRSSKAEVENLVEQLPAEIAEQDSIEEESLEERIRQITDSYLGFTYDSKRGTFGRKSVLRLGDLPIQFIAPPNQDEEFMEKTASHRQYTSNVSRGGGEDLQSHYTSSYALRSAISGNSQQYSLHHIIQIAAVDPDRVEVSAEMRNIIARLPSFSPQSESERQYNQFFTDYGTHVATRLALGGVVRVIIDSKAQVTKKKTSHVMGNEGVVNSTSERVAHGHRIMVFRDGGGSVAPALTTFLEHNFLHNRNSPEWQQIRTKWIQDLEKDPVFCPDHPFTEYQPLYTVRGLTEAERKNLEDAYKLYVQTAASPHNENSSQNTEPSVGPIQSKLLPRRRNFLSVAKSLRDGVTSAIWKFGVNRRPSTN